MASTPEKLTAWEVLANIGESVMVVDREFRIIWLREPMLDDMSPPMKVVGNRCHAAFFGREEPCEYRCPVRPLFETGRPQVVERHMVLPDGRERWREVRAYPIVDRSGRVAFAARISFDITARKLDEARQQRELEGLERSLMEMSSLNLGELPFQPDTGPGLTRRELEVVRLLAQGLSNRRIAGILSISPHTAKRHVVNIFDKLGVNDRAQAAVWAARQGLV